MSPYPGTLGCSGSSMRPLRIDDGGTGCLLVVSNEIRVLRNGLLYQICVLAPRRGRTSGQTKSATRSLIVDIANSIREATFGVTRGPRTP